MTELTEFSDASWQDCHDTGRSTIGNKIFYQGGLIEWCSAVPIPIAMSTDEDEYMSACSACMALAHLSMLTYDLENLGNKHYQIDHKLTNIPNILMIDNEAAVRMSKNYKPTKKNRHIARRYHYVRQGQDEGKHLIIWVPAENQLADDLTKTQTHEVSKKHVDRSMITLPSFMQS